MASQILCRRQIVLFGKDLQTYARGLQQAHKSFSSQGSNPRDRRYPHAIVLLDQNSTDSTVWPDPSLGLLGPKDVRMPLPGNVGFSHKLVSYPATDTKQNFQNFKPLVHELDSLIGMSNFERHYQAIKQTTQEGVDELDAAEIEELLMDLPKPSDVLECIAQDCPKLVRKDFADLFPGRDVTSGPLTVVTLTQKTQSDMSSWSEAVDYEREELTACFVDAAKEICEDLQTAGYWADFIDPSSGRPYLGGYTNATLFETDERYRHFGFTIEDLGCCKVIRHGTWGTHAFVGCIFTNAPVDSTSLVDILRYQQLKN